MLATCARPWAAKVLALAATACLLLLGSGIAVAAGLPQTARRMHEGTATQAPSPTLPTATQQQLEADRPVPVPDTRSCTESLMVHDFASSYGAPFNGSYAPPAGCPGPWSTVVLTLTGTVGGVQFDRDVYVAIGHVVMLDGSTSEPCCTGSNDITWTVSRDVTEYSPVLATPQPVMVELDNVTDSTYTGVYHMVLQLTFYETSATTPAGAAPAVVLPVSSSSPSSPMLTISQPAARPGSAITFPRNLVRLEAELYADAHGPCEEFWWSDPSNCPGTPYREVAVYIDGRLAGAAPTYPVTYTGADGPGLWEPIPSPRAWDLRPYLVDLTPFVATLTDGAAHQISLGILDATLGPGDFWAVAANLLGWVQPGVAVTTGALSAATAPAAPTDEAAWDPSGQVRYTDTASHQLTFAGYVNTANGPVFTRVSENMGETDQQTAATDHGIWNWTESTTTDGAGSDTVATTTASYSVVNTALTAFAFTDDSAASTVTNGVQTAWERTEEQMSTADASGIAYNGIEQERFGYSDSTGACYDRRLGTQAGQVTIDQLDSACPGSGALPVPDLPESPVGAAVLGALGAVTAAGGLALRRRRAPGGRTLPRAAAR